MNSRGGVYLDLGPEALSKLESLATEMEVSKAHVSRMAIRLLDAMRHHSDLQHGHICCETPVYGVAPKRR